MYIQPKKLAQFAKDVQAEIRVFYDNPKNNEKFNAWKKSKNKNRNTIL